MSLKILIFPSCIILSLILIIGYIKPDISSILAKRTEIEKKKEDLVKINTIISNVKQMHAQIDERQEGESFVKRFLPTTLDQEHTMDAFNFLASQSGVTVTEANAEEHQPVPRVIPEVMHASISFQALQPTVDPTVAPVPIDFIKSYEASVTVIGQYQNLKDFLARLYRVDRLHELTDFNMTTLEGQLEDETQYPPDVLELSFTANFPYFHPFKVESALDLPAFQKSRFDFSTIEKLTTHVNNPLPTLDTGETGKPNPFQ